MATRGGEQTQSDECFDVKCTICTRKNRMKQAHKYCNDCRKNLCNDCVEIHNDYNEGHTLVDGHGDDSDGDVLTEKCGKHTDKLIELFCVGHDELVCSICALLEHRNCQELKHITGSIGDLNTDQRVHEVPGQLKTSLQNVNQVLASLEQHVEELSQREDKFLKEIEEYTRTLLAKIETLRQNARGAVSKKHEQAALEGKQKITVCATAKTDIMKCMDGITSAGNRNAHLFILKKKGQSMAKNVETLCRESENMMKRVKFIFKLDWKIEDTLNEFNSLVTENEMHKVSSKVNIDASVKDDTKPCDMQGCCLLPDGTVMLADFPNKRVKHVDTSNCTIKYHCTLKQCPFGITCIGPHEVAVGTGDTCVQVVSLGNNMTCTSTVQLRHKCYRIAQNNGELFIKDNKCVYVCDLTGTLLRTICKNKSGENMFSEIKGIALNQTGDRVYAADQDNGLICTDRTGQELFRRSMEELGLAIAHGVCTDQRGNVLVCGRLSNNVVQITEEGQVIGEILSKADGIEEPKCLCYDADRRRLYVGGCTSNLLMCQLI